MARAHRGISGTLTALLLAMLAISSIYAIYTIGFRKTAEIAEESAQKHFFKILESLSQPPQVVNVKPLLEDSHTAVVEMSYNGNEKIPLENFFLRVELPDSSYVITKPEIVLPEGCLSSDNSFIVPGAYCTFLVNLTKVFGRQIDLSSSVVWFQPVVAVSSEVGGVSLGPGAASEPGSGGVPYSELKNKAKVYLKDFYVVEGIVFSRGNYFAVILARKVLPVPSEPESYDSVVLTVGLRNKEGQLGLGYTTVFSTPQKVDIPERVEKIFASKDYTTCAITLRGNIYCWGRNSWGIASGGTTSWLIIDHPTELQFFRDKQAKEVALGWNFVCALLTNGSVYCWGSNWAGQLGLGDTTGRVTPKAVTFFEAFSSKPVQIVAGSDHTCALLGNGSVYCWGRNDYGQLGLGDTTNRLLPTAVTPFESFSAKPNQITAGGHHTCALLENGSVYCWGRNDYGQLGLGDTVDRAKPRAVLLFESFSSKPVDIVTGAYHTCALLSNGSVYCWGMNSNGQLGVGDTTTRYTPAAVTFFEGFSSKPTALFAEAGQVTCALLENGSVYCWGWNAYGQLGLGDTANRLTPAWVSTLEGKGVVQLAVGQHHTCGITSNGKVYCWGGNDFGPLGIGSNTGKVYPAEVFYLNPLEVKQIVTGENHVCALLSNGSVYCWGANWAAQLGLGDTTNHWVPELVSKLEEFNVMQLAAGFHHTCALLENGSLYCWGKNSVGQLGLGDTTTRYEPAAVTFFEAFSSKPKRIYAGLSHTCALLSNNSLYCWGYNAYGQLGLGDTTTRYEPAAVTFFEAFSSKPVQIAEGNYHTCALLENGSVYCWGWNAYGQLGLGDTANRLSPAAVTFFEGFSSKPIQLVAGSDHTCALLSNGSVYCWGRNSYGQLGLGDGVNRYTPAWVSSLEGKEIAKIMARGHATCALLGNGSVYCWGRNDYGQLALGDDRNRNRPEIVKFFELLFRPHFE